MSETYKHKALEQYMTPVIKESEEFDFSMDSLRNLFDLLEKNAAPEERAYVQPLKNMMFPALQTSHGTTTKASDKCE